MKTQQDIAAEIQALKLISLTWAENIAIKAQIKVLEENMDYNEIYDYYDAPSSSELEISSALIARDWVVDCEAYKEGLAANWS